ncbi:MAG: ABC transporter substrate binding protein [Anaerolineaceae bacterium]|nr:ABC transporter substrate binding protein [Anaerolineaceae bacterium]
MFRQLILALALFLLTVPLVLSADTDNPTIAFLRYRSSGIEDPARHVIWEMFEAYGLISADERALLDEEQDLEGEHINVFWSDAGSDIPTANIMVEQALDRGADVLLTFSTPVSAIAAGATQDMENPPALFFAIVTAPYSAGIASSPCIKPSHVMGSHAAIPYELIVPLLQVQNPDIKMLGTLVNPAEANSVFGAEKIAEYGEALGMTVETVSIASAADLPPATEALADKGVEAILLAAGYVEIVGLPAVIGVANDHGIPVFGPTPNQVYRGAVVGAGFNNWHGEGLAIARMLIGHINGTIDIGTIGISSIPSLTVAVNLDAVEEAGIEISDELLAMAEYVIENGESTENRELPSLPEMTLEERMAEDAAFLAALACTPERIAAEQAELDAAEE